MTKTAKDYLKSTYRTATCGDLRKTDAGKKARLSGWIHRRRDHGGVVFIDLRDNYGITQVVFRDENASKISDVRVESVIQVDGTVSPRDAAMVNSKIETGEVELVADNVQIHSYAEVLPFQISEDDNAPEIQRLTYRFLELRREKLHNNILLRSRVIAAIREIMTSMGFNEFQTPILTSSSPEGARDFIVPSRYHPGKFFALPQAPQQFKQLLMVSGFDRYFQIAPCFRDEDPRADRSPGEFYQLDIEMSYVEQEDVFQMGETLLRGIFTKFSDYDVTQAPFPRIKYDDAMAKYGSDKPDLRNPLLIENVSPIFKDTSFKVFKSELEKLGQIFAIKVPVDEIPPRKYFDDTIAWFTKLSGQGTAYLIYEGNEVKGSVAKFFSPAETDAIRKQLGITGKSLVFFAAGTESKILPFFGRLRQKLGEDFKLIEEKAYRFCWITDYRMYDRDELTGEIGFNHNPFSMPQGGLEALSTKAPLDIYAYQYDIVCNGHELSSGAIRNHQPEIMYKAFELVGYNKEEVDKKFGGMIKAFRYGAPPHGGMAPGIDRIVMLLAKEQAIRDVIAFPMSQTVEDLLMGAPGEVSERQLRDVHIRVQLPPKP